MLTNLSALGHLECVNKDIAELMGTAKLSLWLESKLIESGGEITDEIDQALTLMDVLKPNEVDEKDFILNKLTKEIELWKEQADRYLRVAQGLTKAKELMKRRIITAMEEGNLLEAEGKNVRFKLVKCPPALVIEDEKALPANFMETVVTVKPNAKEIKQALVGGAVVPGAKLTQGNTVRSYVNRTIKDLEEI